MMCEGVLVESCRGDVAIPNQGPSSVVRPQTEQACRAMSGRSCSSVKHSYAHSPRHIAAKTMYAIKRMHCVCKGSKQQREYEPPFPDTASRCLRLIPVSATRSCFGLRHAMHGFRGATQSSG